MKNTYTNSLAHTTWECKCHIVFAPKFRRKEVEIIKAEACPDHVHMYVSIPSKVFISSFMGYLKGKSTLIIFERHANLKYKYGSRSFWCRRYYGKYSRK